MSLHLHTLTSLTLSIYLTIAKNSVAATYVSVAKINNRQMKTEELCVLCINWKMKECKCRVVNFQKFSENISKSLQVIASIIFIQIRRYSWEPYYKGYSY